MVIIRNLYNSFSMSDFIGGYNFINKRINVEEVEKIKNRKKMEQNTKTQDAERQNLLLQVLKDNAAPSSLKLNKSTEYV